MNRGELVVSPTGELLCRWQDGADIYSLQGEDMLELLQEESTANLTPSMAYLRRACVCYVRELLHHEGAKRGVALSEQAPGFDFVSLCKDLPPIPGAEYWSENVLAGGLAKLYASLRRRLLKKPQQILAECVQGLSKLGKNRLPSGGKQGGRFAKITLRVHGYVCGCCAGRRRKILASCRCAEAAEVESGGI